LGFASVASAGIRRLGKPADHRRLRFVRPIALQNGQKVKYWVTLNEQNIFASQGYLTGRHPPGMIDERLFHRANHNAFLASARAIRSCRELTPHGNIGPSFALSPSYPASSRLDDILASDNADEFLRRILRKRLERFDSDRRFT
jgi:beta-glucosidase/6-phospho-beta-glucosidase/beta-galactosidase